LVRAVLRFRQRVSHRAVTYNIQQKTLNVRKTLLFLASYAQGDVTPYFALLRNGHEHSVNISDGRPAPTRREMINASRSLVSFAEARGLMRPTQEDGARRKVIRGCASDVFPCPFGSETDKNFAKLWRRHLVAAAQAGDVPRTNPDKSARSARFIVLKTGQTSNPHGSAAGSSSSDLTSSQSSIVPRV